LGIATAGVMSIFIFSFRRLKEGKRITPEITKKVKTVIRKCRELLQTGVEPKLNPYLFHSQRICLLIIVN
jgi:hypothetical protein